MCTRLFTTSLINYGRVARRLRYCLLFILSFSIASCGSPASRHTVIDANTLFQEFNILVSNKQDVMDAAYQTLLYLYPTSLIMPIAGTDSSGYVVDVESLDLDLYPFNQQLGFGPVWEPSYGYQVRLQFEQTLGRTRLGSIVTGYRYSITTIPRGLNLFYIDDGSDDIDVVFRSMLMKYRIPSIFVTRVV